MLNGVDDTTEFVKGSRFFHSTASFSRAQKFVLNRQMASNQLLLQMTTWILGTRYDSNLTAGGAKKKNYSCWCCSLLPSLFSKSDSCYWELTAGFRDDKRSENNTVCASLWSELCPSCLCGRVSIGPLQMQSLVPEDIGHTQYLWFILTVRAWIFSKG